MADTNGHPVITYLHPRDFDLNQPRMSLPLIRQFKTYVNVGHTFSKLSSLLKTYQFGTLTRISEDNINWSSSPIVNSKDFVYAE